ncbi:hypothetical protein Q5P01_008718 [Channa striata]|uniref:Uncharacterized protein n=1 Tax=Channa striata TaxID=64152 RepID=A0AA88SWR2_CHASR|nr:hypothetical protein Q5P01_008718 [Channa striata]
MEAEDRLVAQEFKSHILVVFPDGNHNLTINSNSMAMPMSDPQRLGDSHERPGG